MDSLQLYCIATVPTIRIDKMIPLNVLMTTSFVLNLPPSPYVHPHLFCQLAVRCLRRKALSTEEDLQLAKSTRSESLNAEQPQTTCKSHVDPRQASAVWPPEKKSTPTFSLLMAIFAFIRPLENLISLRRGRFKPPPITSSSHTSVHLILWCRPPLHGGRENGEPADLFRGQEDLLVGPR